MKRKLGLALAAVRELGVSPIWLYTWYTFQLRSGWLRIRTPLQDWDAYSLSRQTLEGIPTSPESYSVYRSGQERHFFFKPEADLSKPLKGILAGEKQSLIREADAIVKGQFRLFSGPPQNLGFPPDWNGFPGSTKVQNGPGEAVEAHWSRIDVLGLPGDVKLLWELSRFGWVYTLGRAFRLSKDRKYAEAFWQLLESWREVNPPNRGFQWISAQEVAIRLLALIFGHYVFHPDLIEKPRRMALLTETIAAHAERIPPTLHYSRSQGNNHQLVEAVGLFSTGLLFPELKNAQKWHRIGRHWFVSALSKQVFSDGGYVQHSVNYQRLALQVSLWAIRLGELNGETFPTETRDSLRRMTVCLGVLMDPETGNSPNFGSNDGALIFPLTTCSYRDYRPVIQTSNQLIFDRKVFDPGPWDEEGFWFGSEGDADTVGGGTSDGSLSEETRSFPEAGLHILRKGMTWGLLRCANFRNRPGQSDQLHLDLWWKGVNIARDPGTYLYSGVDPWENGLASSKVHNTIVVDELEPMRRAGRFLWLNWAQAEILGRGRSKGGTLEAVAAQNHGYDALGVTAIRSVVRAGEALWMVVDDLKGHGVHGLRSGWLLPDSPWSMDRNSLTIESAAGEFRVELFSAGVQYGLYRAGELIGGESVADCQGILGWYSPTYAHKEPGLYLAASVHGELPLRLVTRWYLGDSPDILRVEWDETGMATMSLKRITFGDEVLEL